MGQLTKYKKSNDKISEEFTLFIKQCFDNVGYHFENQYIILCECGKSYDSPYMPYVNDIDWVEDMNTDIAEKLDNFFGSPKETDKWFNNLKKFIRKEIKGYKLNDTIYLYKGDIKRIIIDGTLTIREIHL
ncbi:MAG: hypothetical protein [Wendovervirus sonii]|uniref:Uncharacterized protein n=1 Tax=phage Lak_Megaphage_Sonny TaxID=3109229 RepID=A0ABZ0Z4Q6_9CAUD|nr:MAG: hypothetical protein [phage Lak_Megaphage_Sonny]